MLLICCIPTINTVLYSTERFLELKNASARVSSTISWSISKATSSSPMSGVKLKPIAQDKPPNIIFEGFSGYYLFLRGGSVCKRMRNGVRIIKRLTMRRETDPAFRRCDYVDLLFRLPSECNLENPNPLSQVNPGNGDKRQFYDGRKPDHLSSPKHSAMHWNRSRKRSITESEEAREMMNWNWVDRVSSSQRA